MNGNSTREETNMANKHEEMLILIGKKHKTTAPWLVPIIPATWKAEIGRIAV
jgi:hypothetical protein